jgi:hypothetical protein
MLGRILRLEMPVAQFGLRRRWEVGIRFGQSHRAEKPCRAGTGGLWTHFPLLSAGIPKGMV